MMLVVVTTVSTCQLLDTSIRMNGIDDSLLDAIKKKGWELSLITCFENVQTPCTHHAMHCLQSGILLTIVEVGTLCCAIAQEGSKQSHEQKCE